MSRSRLSPTKGLLTELDRPRLISICTYRHGYKSRFTNVYLDAFVVGSLGGWDDHNEAVIRELHIRRRYTIFSVSSAVSTQFVVHMIYGRHTSFFGIVHMKVIVVSHAKSSDLMGALAAVKVLICLP